MTETKLPTLSVLIPAYNYERFIGQALQSALDQDYPHELLEVIVVDDGSSDNTVAVTETISEQNPGRVKLIRQQNGGQVAAIGRARAEAGGELIALLDADDVWLPHKARRHAEILQQREEVGLVFNDMRIIDSAGNVVATTLYEPGDPGNNLYARILRTNVVYNSTLTIRSELFTAVPQEIAVHCSWDWWLALQAARQTELHYIPEHLAFYRQHGGNKLLGATGKKLAELRHRQLVFQLWTFRHLDLRGLTPRDLVFAWDGAEWFAGTAIQQLGSVFLHLVEVSDEERGAAAEQWQLAEQAHERGELMAEVQHSFRALAWNPYEIQGATRLREAASRAHAALLHA